MLARLHVGDEEEDDDDNDDEQNSPAFWRFCKPAVSPATPAEMAVVVAVAARALTRNGCPSVERTLSAHSRHCGTCKGTALAVALEAALAVAFATAAAVAAVLWAWCLTTSCSCSGVQKIDFRLLEGRELPVARV